MISRTELQKLIKNCNELLWLTETFDDGNNDMPKYREQITRALRKIVIANEVADRYIIAVAGLQGVGKTTLMKNYYNLDDSFMNIALGRGERLPVFLTEDSTVAKPVLYVYELEKKDKEHVLNKRKVSSQEFFEASKAENEEQKTIIYLEIKIPSQCKDEIKSSFMLLPGYEPEKGEKDYWNTLVEFSANCSDIALYVVKQSTIADQDNEDFKKMISTISADKWIYAISASETTSDNNEGAKRTLMEIAHIKEEESDRVICTGKYASEAQNNKWKNQLDAIIDKYITHYFDREQKGSNYLRGIIREEIKPALKNIERIVKDDTTQQVNNLNNSKWIEYFEERKNTIRKKYIKNIDVYFNEASKKDIDKLLKLVKDQNMLDKFLVKLKSPAEKIKETQKMIDKAMKDDNKDYRYEKAFVDAVLGYTDELCNKPSKSQDQETGIWKIVHQVAVKEQNEDKKEWELILTDIDTILNQRKENGQLKLIETEKDPCTLMRAIVDCAAQYFGLRVVDDLHSNKHMSKYFEVSEMEQSGLKFSEISENVKDMKAFMGSILGITGLDLIVDGEIDFIPSLGNSLGIPVPAAKGFVVALGLVGAADAVIKSCNKMDITQLNYCSNAINEVYSKIKNEYLELYDEYMDSVKEKINDYFRLSKGTDKELIKRCNAQTKLTAVKENITNIIEELGKNGGYMEPVKK